MKIIVNTQNLAIYTFFFSLNFETVNLFNLGIDCLASKISITILLIVSLLNYKTFYSLKHFTKYLSLILFYFVLLTVISLVHISYLYNTFFDLAFFLNILVFLVLINYSRIQPRILLRGLFVFVSSTFILSLLYFLGIDVTAPLEGRYTVFGMNQNILGLNICFSLLILTSIIFENRLNLGKYRYYLFLLFPFLFIFLISTGSRVAFISFVLGTVVFLFLNKSISSLKKALLIIFVFFVFVLIWQLFLKNSLIVERLFDSVNEGDLSSRDVIWLKLFDIISNNFVFGVGKTGYAREVYSILGDAASPHNVLIEVLCYTGIVGLVIFLAFLFRIISNAFKKGKCEGELLPILLLIPIIGMILSGQIFDQKIIWGLFAYISGSMKVEGNIYNLTV